MILFRTNRLNFAHPPQTSSTTYNETRRTVDHNTHHHTAHLHHTAALPTRDSVQCNRPAASENPSIFPTRDSQLLDERTAASYYGARSNRGQKVVLILLSTRIFLIDRGSQIVSNWRNRTAHHSPPPWWKWFQQQKPIWNIFNCCISVTPGPVRLNDYMLILTVCFDGDQLKVNLSELPDTTARHIRQ